MAWLFLDTHVSGQVRWGWLTREQTKATNETARATRTLEFLAASWPADPRTIDGVCVVAGPGSFSAVRTGVLDANLIARWLDVPLVGVDREEATDERLSALVDRLATEKGVNYVAPIYDAEPNITTPKQVISCQQL